MLATHSPIRPVRRPPPAAEAASTQIVVALVVASLAASRAAAHVLSASALAGIVAAAAATIAFIGWPNALCNGARTVLTEAHDPAEPDGPADPWAARRLWTSAARWALLAGGWAAAGGGLIAVALNGTRAGLLVLFVSLAGLGGISAVVVDAVGRLVGARAARRILAEGVEAVPLRRRAWRQIAAPLAVFQAAVNTGVTWMLFHAYHAHRPLGPRPLTRSVVLADVPVTVTVLAILFAVVYTRPWGEMDARLGRISFEDVSPVGSTDTAGARRPIGPQGVVWAALAGLSLAKVADWVLPGNPTLLQAAAVRAGYAAVLVLVFSATGYVRGAVNARAEAGAVPR